MAEGKGPGGRKRKLAGVGLGRRWCVSDGGRGWVEEGVVLGGVVGRVGGLLPCQVGCRVSEWGNSDAGGAGDVLWVNLVEGQGRCCRAKREGSMGCKCLGLWGQCHGCQCGETGMGGLVREFRYGIEPPIYNQSKRETFIALEGTYCRFVCGQQCHPIMIVPEQHGGGRRRSQRGIGGRGGSGDRCGIVICRSCWGLGEERGVTHRWRGRVVGRDPEGRIGGGTWGYAVRGWGVHCEVLVPPGTGAL